MFQNIYARIKEITQSFKKQSFRIIVLKLLCVFLLATLATRLFLIQNVHSQTFVAYVQKSEKAHFKKRMTRGQILDRHQEPLVTNKQVTSITYQYNATSCIEDMYETAEKLTHLIEIDTSKLTKRDLQDLYIRLNDRKTLKPQDVSKAQIESIPVHQVKIQGIFNKMNRGEDGQINTIKFEATQSEIALITENLDRLPGVDITSTWTRAYPNDLGKPSLFGSVSNEDSGLPIDDYLKYLAYGYEGNDRVGINNIEKYHEALLSGKKSSHLLQNGMLEEIYKGQPGFDITLTIDSQLQKRVDDILASHMTNAKAKRPGAKYLREGYVVIMNPHTGEILSMNGKILDDDGKIYDNALGTFQSSFTVGSVVKGATLLAGYQSGKTKFGQVRTDAPMIFSDGSKKASWGNFGPVSDLDALAMSSNTYFLQQTIQMGGDTYKSRKNLKVNVDLIDDMRTFYAKFGLGTYTGIDLDHESIGLRDRERSIAKLLDFVIGQSDTYTTMQLAQYVSTIVTDGKRYKPTLLKSIQFPIEGIGEDNVLTDVEKILYTHRPTLLNQIDLDKEAFSRVKEGFRQGAQYPRGTGFEEFVNSKYNPATKTGTAEEFARDKEGKLMYDKKNEFIKVHNMTAVSFAPFHAPEIAIATVFPQSELPKTKNRIATEVANAVIDSYFELQQERTSSSEKRQEKMVQKD